jgi:peptide/nickel transport system permease protein
MSATPVFATTTAPGRRYSLLWRIAHNKWVRFAVRRTLGLLLVLVFLLVAVFMSVRLIPGDPAVAILGGEASPAEVRLLRHQLGLDQPLFEQFYRYAGDVLHGDLGTSLVTSQPISAAVGERVGSSLELAGYSLLLTMLIGIPLGILVGALTHNGRRGGLDVGYQAVTQFLATVPEFLFATMLAFLLAVHFKFFPVAGTEGWDSIVLPVASLAIGSIAAISRFVRVETIKVLSQDYIRAAESARLPRRIIYFRHVLPNVMTASLTIGGLVFSGLIGGAVIVEVVFARPGLGTLITTAMQARDYPMITGLTLVLGTIVVVMNAVVDVALAIMDKRSLISGN